MVLLLSTRRGYTKEELFREIELYAQASSAAAREKLFDRDKAILREQGIPIESFSDDALFENDNSARRYRINAEEYRLPGMVFTPAESAALALAAGMWDQASLDSAATRAMRKLQARGVAPDAGTGRALEPRIRTNEPHWEEVWRATTSRRIIRFTYRAASTGEEQGRTVHPWGMGTRFGHWYLVGFDAARSSERWFRLSRMTSAPAVVEGTYTVPADFSMSVSLADLDRVGDTHQARVSVRSLTCQILRTMHGATIEEDTGDGWDTVRYPYGDEPAAAARIASLGPHAVVKMPSSLVRSVKARLGAAGSALREAPPSFSFPIPPPPRALPRKSSAEAHLRRLLDLVPYLMNNPGVHIDSAAANFGVTRTELESDLRLLFVSGPRYYPDGLIDIQLEDDRIHISNPQGLAEPVRLGMDEACTLIVGLDTLRNLPGLEEDSAVATAQAKLMEAAGDAGRIGSSIATSLAEEDVTPTLERIRSGIAAGVRIKLTYLVPARDEITHREIEPVRAFLHNDVWYLEAWCLTAESKRNFRLDRMQSVELTDVPAEHRSSQSSGGFPGALFEPSSTDELVTLVLAPGAAWVAESYGAERTALLDDGRLAAEIRVATSTWVPGLVASLGGAATIAAPEPLRERAARVIDSAVSHYA